MASRKLLGICPHCGEPVYEDQDPGFEAEGREDAIHAECANESADEIIERIHHKLTDSAE